MAECDPNTVLMTTPQLGAMSRKDLQLLKVALLIDLTNSPKTVAQLMDNEFGKLSTRQLLEVQTVMACQIVQGV